MDDGSATRTRSRRRLAIGGIGVVLAVVAGSYLDDDPSPSGPVPSPDPVRGPRSNPVTSSELLERPTRGSLASDSAFVDGVRALPWTSGPPETLPDGRVLAGPPEPPPEQRTVVFAGDVPDGRWAVVVGPIDFGAGPGELPGIPGEPDLAAVVFTGPKGAALEQMAIAGGVNSVPANWTPALLDPQTGTVLVIATPGDQVEVSARPEIDADGNGSRSYREVETVDGVAVVQLTTGGQDTWAPTYRVVREGRPQSELYPWPVAGPDDAVPDLSIGFPRGEPTSTGRALAARTADRILGEVGLPSADVQVAAQWVGPLPGSGQEEVAVVTVTLPSGAVVVAAQLPEPDGAVGSSMGGICGRAVLPAGPPASRRMYALTCDVYDVESGVRRGTSLVVVGPRDVTLVRIYGRNGAFVSEHPSDDGVLAIPLPPNTDAVEAVVPGGVSLGRVELLGYSDRFAD